MTITVMDTDKAYFRGNVETIDVDQSCDWRGVEAYLAGPIKNVRNSADRFRATWQEYLNGVTSDELMAKLACWSPEYDWGPSMGRPDPSHERNWHEAAKSPES